VTTANVSGICCDLADFVSDLLALGLVDLDALRARNLTGMSSADESMYWMGKTICGTLSSNNRVSTQQRSRVVGD
jgi:hypothetical protein